MINQEETAETKKWYGKNILTRKKSNLLRSSSLTVGVKTYLLSHINMITYAWEMPSARHSRRGGKKIKEETKKTINSSVEYGRRITKVIPVMVMMMIKRQQLVPIVSCWLKHLSTLVWIGKEVKRHELFTSFHIY